MRVRGTVFCFALHPVFVTYRKNTKNYLFINYIITFFNINIPLISVYILGKRYCKEQKEGGCIVYRLFGNLCNMLVKKWRVCIYHTVFL